MKNNLEGQVITVFTDGGWQAHGEVTLDQQDRMGLESSDGSIFIILKAKISMIQIGGQVTKSEAPQEADDSAGYNLPISRGARGPRDTAEDYAHTEENILGMGNQYGSILPSDMLEGEPEGDQNGDFAVSFATPSGGKIEVKVDPKEEA
jgi:hypothetical protein